MPLCKRLIPVLLLQGGRLVKSREFAAMRDVGSPKSQVRIYNETEPDELIFLNTDRGDRSIQAMLPVLELALSKLFVPIAIGGGVNTPDDASALVAAGADKVIINSAAYRNPFMLREIGCRLGCQAVTVSIDVKCINGEYIPMSDCGTVEQPIGLEAHIYRSITYGAGEIMVNSIDRDGTMKGYDLNLLRRIQAMKLPVPIIACGGCGNYQHLVDAWETGVEALAAGSLFCFTDSNCMRAKAFLRNAGVNVRNKEGPPVKRITPEEEAEAYARLQKA